MYKRLQRLRTENDNDQASSLNIKESYLWYMRTRILTHNLDVWPYSAWKFKASQIILKPLFIIIDSSLWWVKIVFVWLYFSLNKKKVHAWMGWTFSTLISIQFLITPCKETSHLCEHNSTFFGRWFSSLARCLLSASLF